VAKRPTMVEVAAAAGVSQTTVSMILSGAAHARVAAETRERVLKAAASIGYGLPSRVGNAISGTPVIGLLIDEVDSTPFYGPLIDGLDEEARSRGCLAAAYRTHGEPANEAMAIAALRQQNLVGIIYATLIRSTVAPPKALLPIPTVLLNCEPETADLRCVVPADWVGAYTATQTLLEAGHRRIAHLAGETAIIAGREREAGYRQALLNWNVPIDKSLILRGASTSHGGRALTHQLLGLTAPPTALFCFNDRMAIGAYEAIKAWDLQIPEDISIVGFDDEFDFGAYTQPPLTTMVLPHKEMAREAVRLLLDVDAFGNASHPRMLKIECPLVKRGSVAVMRPLHITRAAKTDRTSHTKS
jgi:LacI family transcriptional regulator